MDARFDILGTISPLVSYRRLLCAYYLDGCSELSVSSISLYFRSSLFFSRLLLNFEVEVR